jgi:hypothetical protein
MRRQTATNGRILKATRSRLSNLSTFREDEEARNLSRRKVNNALERFNDSSPELCVCEPGKCAWLQSLIPIARTSTGLSIRVHRCVIRWPLPSVSGNQSKHARCQNLQAQQRSSQASRTAYLFKHRCMPNEERDWSLARFPVPDQVTSNVTDLKPIACGTVGDTLWLWRVTSRRNQRC